VTLFSILKDHFNFLSHSIFLSEVFLAKRNSFFINSDTLLKSFKVFQLYSHIMVCYREDQ